MAGTTSKLTRGEFLLYRNPHRIAAETKLVALFKIIFPASNFALGCGVVFFVFLFSVFSFFYFRSVVLLIFVTFRVSVRRKKNTSSSPFTPHQSES